MKIEIETKFDISDIVWISEFAGTETGFKPSKCRISLIDVQIYDKAIKVIKYFISGIDKCYSESDLFVNKAECQAECDRLNKGAQYEKV